jgi:nicotinate-nucleotide adenylyltransferase
MGGSFDPPHNGHLALALAARELLNVECLFLSPSRNPFKGGSLLDDEHRIQLVELLAKEVNRTGSGCEVCRWEIEQAVPSYTVELIRYLTQSYPTWRFTLILGEDNFHSFHLWKEYQEILRLCHVAVFRRSSEAAKPTQDETLLQQEGVSFYNFDAPLSSTEIREQLRAGLSVNGLLPSSILRYIEQEGLYRG